MRQPFIVTGYLVTPDNMEEIARWCGGHVNRETEPLVFVRVPVNRATHERQSRAYPGMYVLVSKHRGEMSFKVYTKDWLDQNFFQMSDDNIVESTDLIPTSTTVSNLAAPFVPAQTHA